MNSINVLKIGLEAQFTPSLSFFGKQGEVGSKIWKTCYPDWETGGKNIVFKNTSQKELSSLEFTRALVVKENIGEFDIKKLPVKNFETVFNAYTSVITDSTFTRIGIRLWTFSDWKMSFAEISKIMKSKLYPSEENEIYKITSKDIKDVSFAAVYEKNNCSVRFQSGPVTKVELLARTQPTFPIDYLDKIPESSMFYDVDVFKENIKESDFGEFIKNSLKTLSEDIHNFNEYLLKV